jgi:TRAP-type transport system small permease protein
MATPSPEAKILDDSGEFHATDAEIDLSAYRFEDWVAFGFFWALALVVFYQFFTRYALNDSAGWTEEIARYLLICVTFVGAATAVRRESHIHVEFVYTLIGRAAGRVLATFVDVVRLAFLAFCTYLAFRLVEPMHNQRMAIVDLPMSLVYVVVALGFGLMTWRGVAVTIKHWRERTSPLEQPGLDAPKL